MGKGEGWETGCVKILGFFMGFSEWNKKYNFFEDF